MALFCHVYLFFSGRRLPKQHSLLLCFVRCAMSRLLSRISLKYQIGLIGALGILGVVTFGGVWFVSDGTQREIRAVANRMTSLQELMLETDNGLLQLRRHEKDFLLRRDEKYAAAHAKSAES